MSNFSQECTIKMGVESEANETVQLLAEKVFPFQDLCHDIIEKEPNVPIIKFLAISGHNLFLTSSHFMQKSQLAVYI